MCEGRKVGDAEENHERERRHNRSALPCSACTTGVGWGSHWKAQRRSDRRGVEVEPLDIATLCIAMSRKI